jgi:hypothetical protein
VGQPVAALTIPSNVLLFCCCRLQAINRRRAGELEDLQAQVAGLTSKLAVAEAARDEAVAKIQVR